MCANTLDSIHWLCYDYQFGGTHPPPLPVEWDWGWQFLQTASILEYRLSFVSCPSWLLSTSLEKMVTWSLLKSGRLRAFIASLRNCSRLVAGTLEFWLYLWKMGSSNEVSIGYFILCKVKHLRTSSSWVDQCIMGQLVAALASSKAPNIWDCTIEASTSWDKGGFQSDSTIQQYQRAFFSLKAPVLKAIEGKNSLNCHRVILRRSCGYAYNFNDHVFDESLGSLHRYRSCSCISTKSPTTSGFWTELPIHTTDTHAFLARKFLR